MRHLAALFTLAIAACDDIQDTDGSTSTREPDHTPTTSSTSSDPITSYGSCHEEPEEDPQVDINCETQKNPAGAPVLVCETCIGLGGEVVCVPSCDLEGLTCGRGEVCVFEGCLPACDFENPCPKGQGCRKMDGEAVCWPQG